MSYLEKDGSGYSPFALRDSWGDEIGPTMIDEMMVAEKTRVAGGVFNGTTPDTNFYTTASVASGAATVLNSVLDLATTVDSGSSILLYTNSVARYIGGSMNHFRIVGRFGDSGKANNVRKFGVTDTSALQNGFWFQLNGTTMQIVAMTGGVETVVSSGDFNGDASSYVADNNFHTGEILYTNKRVQFFIDKVLVYTFTQTTEVICGTRHLRAFAQNTNTGVGSVCSMYIQVMSIITWGNTKTQPKYYFQQGLTAGVLLKTGIGSLHSTVLSTISNNATVTLYDGTSTAGTVIWTTGPMAANTTPFQVPFNTGLQFINGLYLTVTAAACGCLVMYE